MAEIKDCRIQVHLVAGKRIELAVEGVEGIPTIALTPSASRAIAEALLLAAAMVESTKADAEQSSPSAESTSGGNRLANFSAPKRSLGLPPAQRRVGSGAMARRLH